MRSLNILLLLLGMVLLGGLFWWLRPTALPQAGPAPPAAVEAPPRIEIAAGHRVAGPEVLQVRQGETLTLEFISDQDAELHLHGYDRRLQLKAGQPAVLEVVAEHSGRFEYELHGHGPGGHHALGVIEVMPR